MANNAGSFTDIDYYNIDLPTGVKSTYGAFAGETPYVLSGVPSGPVIIDLDVPTTVEIKDRSPEVMKHRVIIFALFMFAVTAINAQTVNNVEYFLDGDPGYGLTQRITNIRIGENSLTFDISEAEAGAHVLYARAQDSQGRWSTTMSRPIYIERNPDIVRVEYFFDDNDPGKGKAHAMAIPNVRYKGRLDFTTQLDITGLALGEHTLTVRAVNRFDKWTNVLTRKFTIVEGGVDPVTPDPPMTTGDLSRIVRDGSPRVFHHFQT